MDNENKREEILQDGSENTETVVDEAIESTEDAVEEVIDTVEEAPVPEEITDNVETDETETTEADLIGDEWKTGDENGEYTAEEVDAAEEGEVVEELSEEEFQAILAAKKRKKKRGIITAIAIVLVLAIAALSVVYTEGIGSNTVVSNPVSVEEKAEGFFAKLKTDNIKYQNPVVSLIDNVTGNKNTVIKINGAKVDKDVLNFVVNSSALNCVYTLLQMGQVTDINAFDWNKIDEESGLSYLELAKGMAVETLVPIYAVLAEGEKKGIELDEEDKKKIDDWIAEQKKNYGDEFDEVLKQSGYPSEAALYELQRIQMYMQKVYEDIEKDVTKYASSEKLAAFYGDDDKVTVKHILVEFEKDDEGKVTDELKAKAKKEAEEVLAKVKAGGDFDKLIDEYNDDPGATDKGYTFANDGTMVQEFTDASFALKTGETSELVETSYGYHIIKRIERAFTADDYIGMLQKTADVRIKKGLYDNMKTTIDFNYYFGAPEEDAANAEAETEAE